MRITELFTAQSIALDIAAPDQAAILDKLVALQATHGNITDADAYKKALYAREAEASTYVDNGITVPHARAACVTRPSLAALRLSSPVQYNPDDEGKTDLLFAIAAPENGSLHIDMLARMMQMLMNEDFVEKLKAAKTPKEFLECIDAQEEALQELLGGLGVHRRTGGSTVRCRELYPAGYPAGRLPHFGCDRLRQRHCPHLHGRRGTDQGR